MKSSFLFGGNLMLFIVLIIVYTLAAYGAGYGANDSNNTSAWTLYGVFVVIHLLINGFVLYKFKFHGKWVIISSNLMILALYGFLIWGYRPVG
jgi:hypothetical protein